MQGKLYLKNIPPGGYRNKKDRGWFLKGTYCRVLLDTLIGGGGLSDRRRVRKGKVRASFKPMYLTCKLVSRGDLGLLLFVLGSWGRYWKPCLTMLGIALFLFPKNLL